MIERCHCGKLIENQMRKLLIKKNWKFHPICKNFFIASTFFFGPINKIKIVFTFLNKRIYSNERRLVWVGLVQRVSANAIKTFVCWKIPNRISWFAGGGSLKELSHEILCRSAIKH